MRSRYALIPLLTAAMLLALTALTFAVDEDEKKPISVDPSLTGETGIITTLVADSLPKGKFSLGLFYHNFDREITDFDINQYAISLGYGLTDNLELAFSVVGFSQVGYTLHGEAFASPARRLSAFPFPISTIEEGFGDVYFGAKYTFLKDCPWSPGIAARAFVKIPTGNEEEGFGNGATDFGADFISSKHLGNLLLAGNVGFTFRGNPELDGTSYDFGNDFRYGVGGKYFFNRNARFLFELTGVMAFGDDDWPQEDIVDARLGLEFKHESGFRLGVGYTRALIFDDPAARPSGAFAMISFSPWRDNECCREPLSISGFVRDDAGKPISGATITIEGAGTGVTDSQGFYTVDVPCFYTGTATPNKGEYSFTPKSRSYARLKEDQAEQNYVGKLPPPKQFTISGYTRNADGKPIAGVRLAFSGLAGAISDTKGFYKHVVTEGWSGTVTPSLGKYSWEPPKRDYRNVAADMAEQNFTGKLPVVEVSCEIADVYFEFDSDVLRSESVAELNNLVECLKAYPAKTVLIEGHCCYIGTEEYNLALGEARATAIKKFLAGQGIAESRISTVSFGESKPIHDNSQEESRQYNRRGHFVVKMN